MSDSVRLILSNSMKMTLIATIISYLLFFLAGQIVNAGEADRKKWNKRYNAKEYIYGKDPIKFLKENVELLTKGKALVLAMGEGRNAVFLAKNGFDVDGCDISEKAVEKCEFLAWESGVTLNAFVADLEEYNIPADKYDLITCFYYTQRNLIPQIKKGLRKGGMVMFETYTIDQLKYGNDTHGPRNPEYLLKHNELLEFFSDFHILYYREGEIAENKSVASLIAQKK
jgi:tellurite methyltransferase